MKRVMLGLVFIGGSPQKAADVLLSLVKGTPVGSAGMTVGEMRQRMRLVDRLETEELANFEHADLEDADYEVLKRCVEGGSYTIADRGLLRVLDAVLDAKAPPVAPVADDLLPEPPLQQPPSAMALRN